MKHSSLWALVITLMIMVSFLVSCVTPDNGLVPASTSSMETETPSEEKGAQQALPNGSKGGKEENVNPEVTLKEPLLSSDLKRGCTYSSAQKGFSDVGLHTGELAIAFHLRDIDGKEFAISRLLAEKPVVLVFGSFT